MQRINRAVVLSTLLAVCLGLLADAKLSASGSHASAALLTARAFASKVMTLGNVRVPEARRIFGQRPPVAFGQDAGQTQSGATVATDKADYLPNSQVIASGSGWLPNETIELTYTETATTSPDGYLDGPFVFYPVTDGDGNFTNGDFYTDWRDAGVTFRLTARGVISERTAETTFTDATLKVNLDQWANLPGQGWQNGNLNGGPPPPGNSAYAEGEVVPFRLSIEGIDSSTTTTHTIHLNYDFTGNDITNGTHEAYDFLATYSATEVGVTLCSAGGGGVPALCPTLGSADVKAFPSDPAVVGALTVTGAEAFSGVTRNLTLYGGTITSITPAAGPTHSITGNNNIADFLVTFTTGSCVSSNCSVLLLWGGHLAQSAYWKEPSGDPDGAGQIDGANFHMRTQNLDGSGNKNQDRSISPSALVTTLTVIKDLIPSGDSGRFNLQVDGATAGTGANVGDGGTTGALAATPGSHTVGETAAGSTSLSDYDTAISCADEFGNSLAGPGTNPLTVNVLRGTKASCTITNTKRPKLIVIKHVINDNGGTAAAGDFTMSVSAVNVQPSSSFAGAESPGTTVTLNPGTYSVSESGPSGYSQSSSADCSGSIAIAEIKTCTITNDDIAPKLHLRKVVVNDNGGTATVANFTLTADGTGSNDLSGTSPVDSGATLQADTWALSETNVTGYAGSDWVCVGGTQSGSNITVGIGGEATCTITNDDIAPKLHLRKVVVNDNGGTKTVADFTLTADGTGSNDLSGTSPVDSGATLKADTWALSETSVAGYSASSWVCVGGTQSGSNITVGIGGEATCTITNNDIAPKLHLRKYVVNDNGGTATVANFTLTADGTGSNDLSGASPVDSGAGLKADTFSLSESGPPGYSASAWSCVGGSQSGSSITLALGQEATCTITNNDIAPKLHLRKVVVNDNGGTKTVADFTLTANGTGTNDLSGTSPVDSGAGLKADTWALSETNVYGYTASAWVCVGGTQNGSNITLGVGQEATCTITNDDMPGTIVVTKIIKPVGSSTSFSFQTTGTGYNSFNLSAGNSNTQSLSAGPYTVKELVPLGWVLTGIGGSTDPLTPYACTVTGVGGSTTVNGGSSGSGDLNTQTATISLKNGDTVTCIFENTGNGATRTQGFWATHPQLAQIAWFGGTAFGHTFPGVATSVGDTTLCGRSINTLGKVTGAFWSDISKTSTGAKRSALDQARMQLLQQLMAAELNASAFGSAPTSGSFSAWESAYCGSNQNAISAAQVQAGSFNTNGDSSTFTPGTSADSKTARSYADYVFWNVLP